jgi:hypothetical protein
LSKALLIKELAIGVQVAKQAINSGSHDLIMINIFVVVFDNAPIYCPEALPTGIDVLIRIFLNIRSSQL